MHADMAGNAGVTHKSAETFTYLFVRRLLDADGGGAHKKMFCLQPFRGFSFVFT